MSETFDYVVIGAGSAGCVLAARLSEDSSARVLLLEAGPPPRSPWINIPAGVAKLYPANKYNWGYSSEPEPNLNGRQIYAPRGRTLGGSSAINGMAYVRGNPEDYNAWRQLGNRGWGWDDVFPYFKKSEHRDGGGDEFHGNDGEMWTVAPASHHPTSEAFVKSAVNYGLPRNPDYNGKVQEGAGFLQYNIRKGRRHSTAASFLGKARGRPNLKIETDAHVQRITFEGKRATGVSFKQNGTTRQVDAAREVILSAGAFDSPKLLMLSGIGPGAHLQEFGIEVLHDLPGVGQNLQDHYYVNFNCRAVDGASANPQLRGLRAYWSGAKYLMTRKGLLAIGSSEACVFYRGLPNATYPDIQAHFRPVSWEFSPSGVLRIGSAPDLTSSFAYLRPHSRGWVKLKSTDPNEGASMRCNYFNEQIDRDAVVAGIKLLRGIYATEPLKSLIVRELAPGPEVQSDDEMIEYARNTVQTMHHWSCTCAMGSDEMAVVDDELRVHGIEALRVVDASVFPRVTSGNTNAPTIMAAEKASDMIKAAHRA